MLQGKLQSKIEYCMQHMHRTNVYRGLPVQFGIWVWQSGMALGKDGQGIDCLFDSIGYMAVPCSLVINYFTRRTLPLTLIHVLHVVNGELCPMHGSL